MLGDRILEKDSIILHRKKRKEKRKIAKSLKKLRELIIIFMLLQLRLSKGYTSLC